MKNRNFILFFFLSAMLISCREDFVSSVDEESGFEVNLTSELVANREVSASLLRTLSFNENGDNAVLQNAEVMLGGTNLNKGLISMEYQPDRQEYVVQDPEITIKEGNSYNIVIESVDGADEPITASTYIPRAVKANQIPISNVTSVDVGAGQKKYTVELSIVLSEPLDLPAYYRLVPYRILSQETQTSQGTKITDFRKRLDFDIVDIVSNRSAIKEFTHKDGIYADQSRLEGEEIHLILETPEPLAANEVLRIIEVDIYTITQDLYEYNDNLDRQIKNAQSAFTGRTGIFSNVENGHGVLGGASVTTLIINL